MICEFCSVTAAMRAICLKRSVTFFALRAFIIIFAPLERGASIRSLLFDSLMGHAVVYQQIANIELAA